MMKSLVLRSNVPPWNPGSWCSGLAVVPFALRFFSHAALCVKKKAPNLHCYSSWTKLLLKCLIYKNTVAYAVSEGKTVSSVVNKNEFWDHYALGLFSDFARIKGQLLEQSRPCLFKVITTCPPILPAQMMHENYHSPTSIRAAERKGRKGGPEASRWEGEAAREGLCETHRAPSLRDKKGHCLWLISWSW